MRAALVLAALLLAGQASAQNRPSEEDLFGAPAKPPEQSSPAPTTPAPSETGTRPSEDALFGTPTPEQQPSDQKRPDEAQLFSNQSSSVPAPGDNLKQFTGDDREMSAQDPLKIGGQFYTRLYTAAQADQKPKNWAISAPTLVDGYFDARPNSRVRGFVLGRLQYNPSVAPASPAPTLSKEQLAQIPDQCGIRDRVLALNQPATALGIALDQLWLRFDVGRSVFVTAGRQHVRWGTARFWSPNDFLHLTKRDPLSQFDARTGTTMVKVHIPWERTGWNFYGVGLLEDPNSTANTLGQVGGAARAELVLGKAELGIDTLAQKGHRPKFGADLSAGLGPVDFYAEASLRQGRDITEHWNNVDSTCSFEKAAMDGWVPAATVGANWAANLTDVDVLSIGAEYFYNGAGYSNAAIYPWLLLQGAFTPFYLGQHYLGLFANLSLNPGVGSSPSFTFSNLGNLSDGSFVARLDYSMLVLTHLRFEAYLAGYYGTRAGEFRFAIDRAYVPNGAGQTIDMVAPGMLNSMSNPPLFEAGLGLRINI